MNRRIAICIGAILGMAMSPPCASAAVEGFACDKEIPQADGPALVKAVEDKYRSVDTLRAQFQQESYFVGLNQTKESSGELLFKKPGKMNWHYKTPEEQQFVGDGQTLWHYVGRSSQVMIADFKDAFDSDLPVSFLLGVGNLHESFKLQKACKTSQGTLLELVPLTVEQKLRKFLLLVDSSSHVPKGARLLDVADNENTFLFSSTVTNSAIPESQFSFQIPKGVDVIDNRVPRTLPRGAVKEQSLIK